MICRILRPDELLPAVKACPDDWIEFVYEPGTSHYPALVIVGGAATGVEQLHSERFENIVNREALLMALELPGALGVEKHADSLIVYAGTPSLRGVDRCTVSLLKEAQPELPVIAAPPPPPMPIGAMLASSVKGKKAQYSIVLGRLYIETDEGPRRVDVSEALEELRRTYELIHDKGVR